MEKGFGIGVAIVVVTVTVVVLIGIQVALLPTTAPRVSLPAPATKPAPVCSSSSPPNQVNLGGPLIFTSDSVRIDVENYTTPEAPWIYTVGVMVFSNETTSTTGYAPLGASGVNVTVDVPRAGAYSVNWTNISGDGCISPGDSITLSKPGGLPAATYIHLGLQWIVPAPPGYPYASSWIFFETP